MAAADAARWVRALDCRQREIVDATGIPKAYVSEFLGGKRNLMLPAQHAILGFLRARAAALGIEWSEAS